MITSAVTSTGIGVELDATTAASGTNWSASICIVGAGPAGLALAESLRSTGRSIVVLESGGSDAENGAETLLVSANQGRSAIGVDGARARGLGGTARFWNTWFGGSQWAKYVPLDEHDFTERDWVSWSGWPMTRAMLEPWYQRAESLCGISTHLADLPETSGEIGPLHRGAFLLGPAAQFCIALPATLRSSPNVMLVHGATATGLQRTRGGRVSELQWCTDIGIRGSVRADVFVLAAGGVENARFILSDRATTNRPSSNDDWLGRGFMDHPIDRSVSVRSRNPVMGLGEEFRAPMQRGNAGLIVGRIRFAPALLGNEQLPNLSLRLAEPEEPSLTPPAALRSHVHRMIPSQGARRKIGAVLRRALELRERVRGENYRLLIDLEQWPHRDNRVVLTDQRDRRGQPIAMLYNQWRAADEVLRLRARSVVVRELRLARLGDVHVAPEIAIDSHAHHHAGTTRMHDDPAQGVVDANLLVHGEENLYVVGSSVFPTAGVANPTLTIVALSARLGAYLAGKA